MHGLSVLSTFHVLDFFGIGDNDPKKQSKAASDENTQRISDDHIDRKRDLNAIDIKL